MNIAKAKELVGGRADRPGEASDRVTEQSRLEERIDKDLIHPVMMRDIESCIRTRTRWKKVADWTETLAHVFLGFNSILAFLAGVYQEERVLLICAGITSTLSIVLLKFADYSLKESEERHKTLCQYLKYFHVRAPPPLSPRQSESNLTHPGTPADAADAEPD